MKHWMAIQPLLSRHPKRVVEMDLQDCDLKCRHLAPLSPVTPLFIESQRDGPYFVRERSQTVTPQ